MTGSLLPVLRSGTCIACGACTLADPGLKLALNEKRLMYEPENESTAAAASVCPAVEVDFDMLQSRQFPGQAVTPIGVVDGIWLAQSVDEKRNLSASSGGMIRELILQCFESGSCDAAIALTEIEALQFEPSEITSAEEVDRLPGSIYHNVPLDRALQILRERPGRFVLVGIPCQLEGVFKYIFTMEPELKDRIVLTIGLICGWNYSHHSLRAISDYKGLDYDDIRSISYRGGGAVGKLQIATSQRSVAISRRIDFSYQVAFDRSFNIPRCHLCVNHCNLLADIVVGDAWLPETVYTRTGVSLVICRKIHTSKLLQTLAEKNRIRIAEGSETDVIESQSHNVVFGDFAYSYAEYLTSIGEHVPVIRSALKQHALPVDRKTIARFHDEVLRKRELQEARRYRTLWWRKAVFESGSLFMKYWRWFVGRFLRSRPGLTQNKRTLTGRLTGFR